jgi:hypothetical protein
MHTGDEFWGRQERQGSRLSWVVGMPQFLPLNNGSRTDPA